MPKKEFTGGGGKEAAFIRTLDGHRVPRNDSPMSRMSPDEVGADTNDRRNLSTADYSGNDHTHKDY